MWIDRKGLCQAGYAALHAQVVCLTGSGPRSKRKGAHMELYAIIRRKGWATGADLEEAAGRSSQVGDEEMSDDIRWIRSYVLSEEDGSVGTLCIYEASGPEAIREHAERAGPSGGRGHPDRRHGDREARPRSPQPPRARPPARPAGVEGGAQRRSNRRLRARGPSLARAPRARARARGRTCEPRPGGGRRGRPSGARR